MGTLGVVWVRLGVSLLGITLMHAGVTHADAKDGMTHRCH